MDVQIRPCASADEVRQAISPIGHYFGRSLPNDELRERLIRFLPAERVYAAWEDGRAVGGLGAFPLQLGWVIGPEGRHFYIRQLRDGEALRASRDF